MNYQRMWKNSKPCSFRHWLPKKKSFVWRAIETTQFERQATQFERQANQFEQQATELSATISAQEKKLAAKEQTIRELLQALRGKTRERIDPDQLLLFEIGELETLIEEALGAEKEPSKPRRKRKRGRRVIPDNIPVEIIEHELPENQRVCKVDGQVMPRIRWEESTQLDFVPAQIKKLIHRRAVYACPEKHDQATLITAPKPPQPIEKGLPTAGLLSQVVVSKFGDHLPGYRQEDIFSRHGINIRRSTIYSWLAAAADLCQPLYRLMADRVLDFQSYPHRRHESQTDRPLDRRHEVGSFLGLPWRSRKPVRRL